MAERDVAITLTVNGEQFQAQMRNAGESVRNFGRAAPGAAAEVEQLSGILKGFAGAAAAGFAAAGVALANIAKQGFDAAQATSEAASRLGVSFNQFQALTLAAEGSGFEMENVTKVASKLAGVFADSLAGKTGAASEALQKLGISSAEMQRVQNDSVGQLKLVADGFAAMESGAVRTALASDLLGEKNADMVRLLEAGAGVFSDAEIAAKDFGLALSDDAVRGINAADDAMDEFSARLKGIKTQLGAEIAPALERMAQAASLLLGTMRGAGIYANLDKPGQGQQLRAPASGFGLSGAIPLRAPQSPQATIKAAAGLGLPGSGILVSGSPEVARRDAAAAELLGSIRAQMDSLQKLSQVEKARRELLAENIPLESRQAATVLEAARAVDALTASRSRSGSAARSAAGESAAARDAEAQSIRRQQEKNLLLETELRLGTRISGAQAELLLLNRTLEPITSTSLRQELEKTVALEGQVEASRDLAKLKADQAREAEREVEAYLRASAPRSEGRDGIQSIRDSGDTFSTAALDGAYQVTRENELAALQANLDQLEDARAMAREAGLDREAEFAEREVQMRVATNGKLAAADAAYAATKREIQNKQLQAAGEFFGNLASVAEAYGEQGFEAYKAFAIAETVISTYQSAQNAYNSLSKIPYVGPALGVAAAAAAVAAGLARVRMIEQQQPAGREFGGAVAGNQIYQVGEGNQPELLRANGKSYLIPGDGGGSVVPARSASGGAMAGGKLKVEVINLQGQTAVAREQEGPDGQQMIQIVIQQVRTDIATGGPIARQMESSYPLARRGR